MNGSTAEQIGEAAIDAAETAETVAADVATAEAQIAASAAETSADAAAEAATQAAMAAGVASNLANANAAEMIAAFSTRLAAAEQRADEAWTRLQTMETLLTATQSELMALREMTVSSSSTPAEEVSETIVAEIVNPENDAEENPVVVTPRKRIRLL